MGYPARVACVPLALINLSIIPCLLAYYAANVSQLPILVEPWSGDDEMVAYLGNRLSLMPNPRFRGSVVLTSEDYRGSLTQDSLLRAFIPTLNEYSQLVTEQMYALLHGVLTKYSRVATINRLPLFPINTPDWANSYVKLTGALGTRFVLSPSPLNFQTAGNGTIEEKKFTSHGAFTPITWYAYELPITNVGNYSPTVLYRFERRLRCLKKWRLLHLIIRETP